MDTFPPFYIQPQKSKYPFEKTYSGLFFGTAFLEVRRTNFSLRTLAIRREPGRTRGPAAPMCCFRTNDPKKNDLWSQDVQWGMCRPAKHDFGGIRTHAQKTAALTQRLRPLGHEVAPSTKRVLENLGIEPKTSCMLSTRSTN